MKFELSNSTSSDEQWSLDLVTDARTAKAASQLPDNNNDDVIVTSSNLSVPVLAHDLVPIIQTRFAATNESWKIQKIENLEDGGRKFYKIRRETKAQRREAERLRQEAEMKQHHYRSHGNSTHFSHRGTQSRMESRDSGTRSMAGRSASGMTTGTRIGTRKKKPLTMTMTVDDINAQLNNQHSNTVLASDGTMIVRDRSGFDYYDYDEDYYSDDATKKPIVIPPKESLYPSVFVDVPNRKSMNLKIDQYSKQKNC